MARVLVLEDHPEIIEIVTLWLERVGRHEVQVTTNLEDFLGSLDQRVDVAVLDWRGRTTARATPADRLGEQAARACVTYKIPVVGMSVQPMAGFGDCFYLKEQPPRRLLQLVNQVLGLPTEALAVV